MESEIDDTATTIKELDHRVGVLRDENALLNLRCARIEAERDDYKAKWMAAGLAASNRQNSIDVLENANTDLTAEIARLTSANEEQRRSLETAIDTIGQRNRERDALRAALKSLDAVIDFSVPGSEDKPWIFEDWSDLNTAFDKARAALDYADEQGTSLKQEG